MLTAVLGAGALVLLAAGAAKVVDPSRTAGALGVRGWPSGPVLVRAGAAAELLVGAGALVVGGPVLASLVALSYLAFALFVASALTSGTPIGSCGCLGRADTPPTALHVVVDAALAAGALAAAATNADPLLDAGLAELAGAIALAAAAVAALTQRQSLKITT
jgi:methylamine utilization protein MauE